MTRVFRREPLAEEHVAEVAAAVHAGDLGPVPVRVRRTKDRAGDLVVEARPAAVGIELVLGTVQRRVAATAVIGPRRFVGDIFAAPGHLGALVNDDAFLFTSQLVELVFHGG